MRKLYEIDADIEKATHDFLESLEPDEDGVVNADTSLLDALEFERTEKIESLMLAYINLCYEFESVYGEFKKFRDWQQSLKNKRDNLKAYIERVLDGKEFKTDKVRVRYTRTTTTELDEGFQDIRYGTLEFKPDRMAIKDALKKGETIEGAKLVDNISFSIK